MTADKIVVLYRWRRGRLESGGLPYETMGDLERAFPLLTHELVEDKREAIRTEATPAGRQVIIAETPPRKVPSTAIRAKRAQTERPTPLESYEADSKQGRLL